MDQGRDDVRFRWATRALSGGLGALVVLSGLSIALALVGGVAGSFGGEWVGEQGYRVATG